MVAKLPKARSLVLLIFSPLIWESVFISLLFEMSSWAVITPFYVACHLVINFIFSSRQLNTPLLTSTLSYILGFLSYIGKRFFYLSPKFSFSLVSNFAISISMFWLVAITSFPSWDLVAFSQSLQHADLCHYEFQLFHPRVLHFYHAMLKRNSQNLKG